jgi:hypothetical protein
MGWPNDEPGHWHGYAWIGSGRDHAEESLRRPGVALNESHTQAFVASKLPPLMTGHWLMKRNQTSADRTWTDVTDAVVWLTAQYDTNPPFKGEDGLRAYDSRENWVAGAYDRLPGGSDIHWCYWTQGGSKTSFAVVCCRNHFHPDIPCPLPPS